MPDPTPIKPTIRKVDMPGAVLTNPEFEALKKELSDCLASMPPPHVIEHDEWQISHMRLLQRLNRLVRILPPRPKDYVPPPVLPKE